MFRTLLIDYIMNYTITLDNIHIEDSYKIGKHSFKSTLNQIKSTAPAYYPVMSRSTCGMCLEWAAHNFLYNLHLWRSHTKDVDLDHPQKWYTKVAFFALGSIGWLFIR